MSSYSYSRLDLYNGCPLAYKYRYLDGRQEAPSEALERGSEVHEWIAAYTRHLLAKGLQTDLDWIRGANASPEAREILDTFAETHLLAPGGEYTLEETWTFPLNGHVWRGVIDLINVDGDAVTITDYKSDHRVRSQSEVEKDLQLRAYAWMAAKKYPETDVFACRIDFVRFGVTREVRYEREDVPTIEEELITAIERIEADTEYTARPGTRCAWCSWTEICHVLSQGELEVITGSHDAERAASQLIVFKARVKALEEMLKPYTTREGPIAVNGMAVGFSTTHSAGYELRDAWEVFKRFEYPEDAFLRVDTTAVKKLIAKDDKLAAALEAVAIDKSSSKFGVRKGDAS